MRNSRRYEILQVLYKSDLTAAKGPANVQHAIDKFTLRARALLEMLVGYYHRQFHGNCYEVPIIL